MQWGVLGPAYSLSFSSQPPRGNALLVGVGGSGKASIARFAACVAGLQLVALEPRRGYGLAAFREDVKRAYKASDVPKCCFSGCWHSMRIRLTVAPAAGMHMGQQMHIAAGRKLLPLKPC
jgi:hypothetical protein